MQFLFKITKHDCFKCKSWQAAHLKCFCSNWLLQIQNQQAALWNYLAPCKWTTAIPTLPPTRFCENHWHAVSTCKWLLRVANVSWHRVKISHVWVTAAIWLFLGSCLARLRKPNLTWILRRVCNLRDLRKKKGKMSILAATSLPCKCGFSVFYFDIRYDRREIVCCPNFCDENLSWGLLTYWFKLLRFRV